jgi:ubiquitin carboxyl-terminal hydrolase 7
LLQDARKGVLFDQLPPVLQLQLKRFEYDFARDTMVKVRPACTISLSSVA